MNSNEATAKRKLFEYQNTKTIDRGNPFKGPLLSDDRINFGNFL